MKHIVWLFLLLSGTSAFAQVNASPFNTATNSWSVLSDAVVVSLPETSASLEMAKHNVELAFELNKSAEEISSAYFALSATQLALGNFDAAKSAIDLSSIYADEVYNPVVLAFNEAFKGVIFLSAQDNLKGAQLFESGTAKLNLLANDEAIAYLQKLDTAIKVFVK